MKLIVKVISLVILQHLKQYNFRLFQLIQMPSMNHNVINLLLGIQFLYLSNQQIMVSLLYLIFR